MNSYRAATVSLGGRAVVALALLAGCGTREVVSGPGAPAEDAWVKVAWVKVAWVKVAWVKVAAPTHEEALTLFVKLVVESVL